MPMTSESGLKMVGYDIHNSNNKITPSKTPAPSPSGKAFKKK